jgi:hypothetical protein
MEYNDNPIVYKLENIAIDKIYKSDKNKDGVAYVSSKGNPFKKVDIYIDARSVQDNDFAGKMSYFDYFGNSDNWDIGTTISGTVSRTVANGRTYFNFQLPPSQKKALDLDIKELTQRVEQLEKQMVQMMKLKGHSQEVDDALDMSKEMLNDDEIQDSDLPF